MIFFYLYTVIQNIQNMSVKKSNEKVFYSPKLGELISDAIVRHKMSAFLRNEAGMRQSVVDKLKRGN